MTLNEQIIKAVTQIVAVCVPDLLKLEPDETPPEEYCVFSYSSAAALSADNAVAERVARVQLAYCAPLEASTVRTRARLAAAIAAVDTFSLPTITPATDELGQQYVYEFDAIEEADDGDV